MAETTTEKIDSWLEAHNLNEFGDPHGSMYAGGTPLFDERTGKATDRLEYLMKKFPATPWDDQESEEY